MRADLVKLVEQIQGVELNWQHGAQANIPVPTAFPEVDAALPHGGLLRGAVHEWLSSENAATEWKPAFSIIAHLARQALQEGFDQRRIVWVGENAWPYGLALVSGPDRRLIERSLFLRPRDRTEQLWAIELSLRSSAVACVVADASGFDRVALRRLQLSAEAGDAIGLLARPVSESNVLSSAVTRWVVERRVGSVPGRHVQGWKLRLLRCKGVQPTVGPREWAIERDHATGTFHISPPVAHRPAEETQQAARAG